MDRRSFLASLIGGLAAAGSLGTAALAAPQPVVEPPLPESAAQVDAEALDKAAADYARYHYRRRRHWRRHYRRHRHYRRRYYYRRRWRPHRRYYYRRRYW